jgi:hypothetical protein
MMETTNPMRVDMDVPTSLPWAPSWKKRLIIWKGTPRGLVHFYCDVLKFRQSMYDL